METKLDRRSARTRDSLRRALHELLQHKSYEQITSAEICEHANVGRSTFYVHFKSRDDLKSSVFEPLRKVILEEAALVPSNIWQGRALAFSRPVFEHAYVQRVHYRLIANNRGGRIALRALRRMLLEHIRSCMPEDGADGRSYLPEYLVGGFLSMLVTWLDRGAPESPSQMNAQFTRWARVALGSA